jgi:membrane protease subunit (stomatin/prohibitin family)
MNMAGDMARFQQFQAGLAVEKAADQEGGIGGAAVLLGGLGNMLGNATAPAAQAAASPTPAGTDREQVMQLLRDLGQLKADGILTAEEFDAKKAELLARL